MYTDSDVYKWIEAASWSIASNETSEQDKSKFRGQIESLTADIVAAQEPSGYLNTYYVGEKAHLRFTEMTRSHEGYCLGHLIRPQLRITVRQAAARSWRRQSDMQITWWRTSAQRNAPFSQVIPNWKWR